MRRYRRIRYRKRVRHFKRGFNKQRNFGNASSCQFYNCTNSASMACRYCNRKFCQTHSDPILAQSHNTVTNLTDEDYRADPELYQKRIFDWKRTDGHACSQYTEWWLKKHREDLIHKQSYQPSYYSNTHREPQKGYDQHYEMPVKSYTDTPRSHISETDRYKPIAEKARSKKTSKLLIVAVVLIIVIFVAFLLIKPANNNFKSKPNGISYNPYNASLGYQGKGYYVYKGNEIYVINQSQFNVDTQSISTTQNTTITTLSTTVQPPVNLNVINSTWATEFFANVSSQRDEQYNNCPSLNQFAQKRFNTITANYQISHYGYQQDFNQVWPNGYVVGDEIWTAFAEEYYFPIGYTPSEYVTNIQETAPLHWQLLLNSNLTYYGYYIGSGPNIATSGYCDVTEIPGPNINITQFDEQNGCTPITTYDTYFIVELAPVCPS